jgi:hypothetical protein
MTQKLTLSELVSHIKKIQAESNVSEDVNLIVPLAHLQTSGKFPIELRKFFGPFSNKIFRCGTITKIKKNNVSLYSSVLHLLSDVFATHKKVEQELYLEIFFAKFYQDFNQNELYKKYKYNELGWDKKIVSGEIKNGLTSPLILRVLADYFEINIFLLTFEDEKVTCVSCDTHFNQFKHTIFLSQIEDVFEPIIFGTEKTLTTGSAYFKIITENKSNIIVPTFNLKETHKFRKFVVSYSSDCDIENNYCDEYYDKKKPTTMHHLEETEYEVVKKRVFEKKIPRELISSKLGLFELQKIAKEYDVSISSGKYKTGNLIYKTKAELFKELTQKSDE